MPPTPKPTEMKRLLGNPGKRSLPRAMTVLAPATVMHQDPPQTGYDLVAALLASPAAAWIGETDQLVMLQLLREGWDRRARLLADLESNGSSYAVPGDRGTRWYARPEVNELRDLEAQITKWLSALGLDPSSRGKLGVAEVKAQSALERIRANRAKAV